MLCHQLLYFFVLEKIPITTDCRKSQLNSFSGPKILGKPSFFPDLVVTAIGKPKRNRKTTRAHKNRSAGSRRNADNKPES